MTKMIDFVRIEKKWQRKWEKEKAFEVKEGKKKKWYVLEMYPYPSGGGLHMGHAFNYTIGDIQARMKRMQGFNVLYPMGYDSFGLPAENAAVKAKAHPKRFTENAIKNFVKQQKSIGLSYDWTRMLKSHDSDFYRWDQWIFLKMFEKGLAYRKKAPVNWCKKCRTVLANEQVKEGCCYLHEDTEVEIRQLEQWFLKITDYADELYEGLDRLEGWPERIKIMQRNWIGKSQGIEIDFVVNGKKWSVFTTRPDTLFGVTFMVVSAQHPDLMNLVTERQEKKVEVFLKKVKSTREEDLVKLEKEGVFTGSYATHPLSGEKIPIWAGNFVVVDYGSGMVMAVPAHDQRDFEFANKYEIPIKVVVCPNYPEKNCPILDEAYTGFGYLIGSGGFDGLKSEEAKAHVTNALEMKKMGRKRVAFRLKDWLISRQRFWGCPIPIIYCDKCGIVPVNEKELPIKLPDGIKFESKENPLKKHDGFLKTTCPKCGEPARRETDTMDTFIDSSWYFLRYCDSKNKKEIFDKKKVDYWMPIDQYVGGKEHTTGHLIYFRFFTKFLRDIGLLKIDEPVVRLFNQGMLHGADGQKMSKSKGNIILPEEISAGFGMDAARMFLVSVASPGKDIDWSDRGAEGSLRFVLKVSDFVERIKKQKKDVKISKLQESKLNRVIRDYTSDLEGFRYNLAVIKLRELLNVLEESCGKKHAEVFLKLLSPVCPHISEELWNKLGNKTFISLGKWPEPDLKKINDKLEEQEKQVEKTVEDVKYVLELLKEKQGKTAKKVLLYVLPGELKNYDADKLKDKIGKEVDVYAVNDKDKYDPENKSKKVKPGRPGIYVE